MGVVFLPWMRIVGDILESERVSETYSCEHLVAAVSVVISESVYVQNGIQEDIQAPERIRPEVMSRRVLDVICRAVVAIVHGAPQSETARKVVSYVEGLLDIEQVTSLAVAMVGKIILVDLIIRAGLERKVPSLGEIEIIWVSSISCK